MVGYLPPPTQKTGTGIFPVPEVIERGEWSRLGQVVAERGPYHVVHALGRNTGAGRAIISGPA